MRSALCLLHPEGFKDFEEPAHWLTIQEVERLLQVFAWQGLKRVRLTGGEPLWRRHVDELARRITALPGIEDVSLTTNATQLAKMAHKLRSAGVSRLNVSLDSLRPETAGRINGRPVL